MLPFTKIMHAWKRCICTGYSVSTNWHSGLDDNMAGTNQGNNFSGDLCRGASCLIIKHVENKNLGMTIKSPCTNAEEQIVSISCVDDTDIMTDGEDNVENTRKHCCVW